MAKVEFSKTIPSQFVKGIALNDYIIEGIKLGYPFVRESVERCMKLKLDASDVIILGYPSSGVYNYM